MAKKKKAAGAAIADQLQAKPQTPSPSPAKPKSPFTSASGSANSPNGRKPFSKPIETQLPGYGKQIMADPQSSGMPSSRKGSKLKAADRQKASAYEANLEPAGVSIRGLEGKDVKVELPRAYANEATAESSQDELAAAPGILRDNGDEKWVASLLQKAAAKSYRRTSPPYSDAVSFEPPKANSPGVWINPFEGANADFERPKKKAKKITGRFFEGDALGSGFPGNEAATTDSLEASAPKTPRSMEQQEETRGPTPSNERPFTAKLAEAWAKSSRVEAPSNLKATSEGPVSVQEHPVVRDVDAAGPLFSSNIISTDEMSLGHRKLPIRGVSIAHQVTKTKEQETKAPRIGQPSEKMVNQAPGVKQCDEGAQLSSNSKRSLPAELALGQASQHEESSPYRTKLCYLYFGKAATCYTVHDYYLQQAPKIIFNNSADGTQIYLPEIHEDIAHTIVHYLYTGSYQTLESNNHPAKDRAKMEYRRSVLVYCVGATYGLATLSSQAATNMENFDKSVSIFTIIENAREAFATLKGDKAWYMHYLKSKIEEAFERDEFLFTQPRFLKHLGKDKHFDRALFSIMANVFSERISSLRQINDKLKADQLEELAKIRSEPTRKAPKPKSKQKSSTIEHTIMTEKSMEAAPAPGSNPPVEPTSALLDEYSWISGSALLKSLKEKQKRKAEQGASIEKVTEPTPELTGLPTAQSDSLLPPEGAETGDRPGDLGAVDASPEAMEPPQQAAAKKKKKKKKSKKGNLGPDPLEPLAEDGAPLPAQPESTPEAVPMLAAEPVVTDLPALAKDVPGDFPVKEDWAISPTVPQLEQRDLGSPTNGGLEDRSPQREPATDRVEAETTDLEAEPTKRTSVYIGALELVIDERTTHDPESDLSDYETRKPKYRRLLPSDSVSASAEHVATAELD